ncbi:hypothetical protein [Methanosphaera sp.]|uniref:hypothetical protein n=1 Tax=Methanosphaera sp. TaxID=2666342 RepID=UPI0025D2631E|nr:hypothetical protein [Methanosphaera sp.]
MTINSDINTRIEITNETVKDIATPGQAGKMGLIGAFPSINQDVYCFGSIEEVYDKYGVVLKSNSWYNFDGPRAAHYLFHEDTEECDGVTNLTCVNITDSSIASSELSTTVVNSGSYSTAIKEIAATKLSYTSLKEALIKLSDEDIDAFMISSDIRNAIPKKDEVSFKGETFSKAGTINDVYELIAYYQNNVFSIQKPVYWINWLNDLPGTNGNSTVTGINTSIVNVPHAKEETEYYDSIDKTSIGTAGWYCQPLEIHGANVTRMEAAAHIAGFMATLPIGTSLTNKVIPGITGIPSGEEMFFGKGDAGEILMNSGVQVIKPYNRKDKTYCIKNSIQPSGYDVAHVRTIAYLLRQYDLISTIGETNDNVPIEALKAQIKAKSEEVRKLSNRLIIEVTIGKEKILSPWKIYIPIRVRLRGIINVIKLGVSMEIIDESNAVEVSAQIEQ